MKGQKMKDVVGGVKTYFVEMPKKRRTTVLVILGAVVAFAVALTVYLNYNSSQYKVLYRGLEPAEKNSIYQMLQEQGVAATLNPQGEITVPASQYDELLLQLAGQGYPQSALAYDVFSNYTGLTATEAEQKQGLLFQLQDRIQGTLQRVEGIKGATVTITIPDTSDYIWQQAEQKEQSSASVLLKLDGKTLNATQVDAVRKLVASGCPNMEPDNVTVVDAATSLELYGTNATSDGTALGFSSTQNLELESMMQKKLEDAIKQLLVPRYGQGGVEAAAKVTLNYDKMITEENQMQEKPDGGGNLTHIEGQYSLNGNQAIGGLVGENDNTDIPGYGYNGAGDGEDVTNHSWNADYAYSYIKKQIEKNNADLERATISVMVNEPNLTQAMRTELTQLISTAVDIPVAQITLSTFTAPQVTVPEEPTIPQPEILVLLSSFPWWVWFLVGFGVILITVVLIMIAVIRRKAKKRQLEEKKRLEEEAVRKVNEDINEYKRQLSEAAKGGTSDVDEAIMNEVKDFAKHNPEVTANLLRSWLKDV